MNKKITTNELNKKIGDIVLTFGNLETAISTAILLLVSKIYENKLVHVFKFIVSQNDARKNLEILNSFICSHTENIDVWKECYKSLCSIFDKRNSLVHGMYFCDEKNIIKVGKKFNDMGIRIENKFSIAELVDIERELNERYRQMFDSFIDCESLWICKYPKIIL